MHTTPLKPFFSTLSRKLFLQNLAMTWIKGLSTLLCQCKNSAQEDFHDKVVRGGGRWARPGALSEQIIRSKLMLRFLCLVERGGWGFMQAPKLVLGMGKGQSCLGQLKFTWRPCIQQQLAVMLLRGRDVDEAM